MNLPLSLPLLVAVDRFIDPGDGDNRDEGQWFFENFVELEEESNQSLAERNAQDEYTLLLGQREDDENSSLSPSPTEVFHSSFSSINAVFKVEGQRLGTVE